MKESEKKILMARTMRVQEAVRLHVRTLEEEVQDRAEVTKRIVTGSGTEAGSLDKSKNRPMKSGNALVTSRQRKIATPSQRIKDWSNERNIARLKEDSFGEGRSKKG